MQSAMEIFVARFASKDPRIGGCDDAGVLQLRFRMTTKNRQQRGLRCCCCCFPRLLPLGQPGAALELGVGEHRAAALRSAAVAIGFVGFVRVIEVVLVDQFFAGGDVADGADEDSTARLLALAVGRAGVVEEHRRSKAVDYIAVVPEAEDIGDDAVGVALIDQLFGEARAVVLDDAAAARDGVQRVAPSGVDGGGADEEAGRIGSFYARHWPEYSKTRGDESR